MSKKNFTFFQNPWFYGGLWAKNRVKTEKVSTNWQTPFPTYTPVPKEPFTNSIRPFFVLHPDILLL